MKLGAEKNARKRTPAHVFISSLQLCKHRVWTAKSPRMLHVKSTALGYRRSAFSSKKLIQRFRKGLPLFSFSGLGLDICICIEAIRVEKGYYMEQ